MLDWVLQLRDNFRIISIYKRDKFLLINLLIICLDLKFIQKVWILILILKNKFAFAIFHYFGLPNSKLKLINACFIIRFLIFFFNVFHFITLRISFNTFRVFILIIKHEFFLSCFVKVWYLLLNKVILSLSIFSLKLKLKFFFGDLVIFWLLKNSAILIFFNLIFFHWFLSLNIILISYSSLKYILWYIFNWFFACSLIILKDLLKGISLDLFFFLIVHIFKKFLYFYKR